jgi:uncharacterized delta-60 repeat protein
MKTLLSPPRLLGTFATYLVLGLEAKASAAVSSVLPISTRGHDRFFAVAFDKNGNYYAAGSVSEGIEPTDDSKTVIAKFSQDGNLDASFGVNGYAVHNLISAGSGEVARAITVDNEGRVVVGGSLEAAKNSDARDRDVYAIRLLADGTLDQTYGVKGVSIVDFSEGEASGNGFVADGFGGFALDAKGRLVLEGAQKREGGLDTDFVIARLTADGALDASFASQGKFVIDNKNLSASAKTPIIMPDGSIIGTGYNRDGVNVPFVFKVDSDGVLDTAFGIGGIFQEKVLQSATEVYGGILHGDEIITVGYGKDAEEEDLDFLSLRINVDGKLDPSYGGRGYVRIDVDGFNDNGRFLAAIPDGRVALVGGGRYTSANVDGMVAILNEDGSTDESFGENGTQLFDFGGSNDFLWGAAVSPSGDKLVSVGIKGVTSVGGNDDAAVVVIPLEAKP